MRDEQLPRTLAPRHQVKICISIDVILTTIFVSGEVRRVRPRLVEQLEAIQMAGARKYLYAQKPRVTYYRQSRIRNVPAGNKERHEEVEMEV